MSALVLILSPSLGLLAICSIRAAIRSWRLRKAREAYDLAKERYAASLDRRDTRSQHIAAEVLERACRRKLELELSAAPRRAVAR